MNDPYDLAGLASRLEITDLIYRYCRGADRRDEALFRSVFHPDSTHKHGAFEGLSSEFCTNGLKLMALCAETHHHIGNILIELDGDRAVGESYFVAHHRIAAETPAFGPLRGHRPGIDEDWFVGGRYQDRFERRSGVWKIARRVGVHDWERWQTADDRGFQLPASRDELRGRFFPR